MRDPLFSRMTTALRLAASVLVVPLVAGLGPAAQAATPEAHLTITHQAFQPDTLTIPAGKTVKIIVKNQDALPAEFESNDFNREKVIPGGSQVPVWVGPLTPGTYTFFNDFYPQSTGRLVVVAPASSGAGK